MESLSLLSDKDVNFKQRNVIEENHSICTDAHMNKLYMIKTDVMLVKLPSTCTISPLNLYTAGLRPVRIAPTGLQLKCCRQNMHYNSARRIRKVLLLGCYVT